MAFQAIAFLESLFAVDSQPARQLDLEGFRLDVRGVLEEFASAMGEDLLAVSRIRCSWPDCRFPATVLIATWQETNRERIRLLVWGCPRCGRQYQPKILSPIDWEAHERLAGYRPLPALSEPPEEHTPDLEATPMPSKANTPSAARLLF